MAQFAVHADIPFLRTRSWLIAAHRRLIVAVLAFVLGVFGGLAAFQAPAFADASLESVRIETKSGPRVFEVEVMRTEAERERGLMFRPYLPAGRGMLFEFEAPRTVLMWMKDTLIPLDMLFIRSDGTVARIAENAEPESTRTIASGEAVAGVLEINAGLASKLGIKPNDRVIHPFFTH
jgi:uncharacterized membrane protein (UPF0127 family)